MDLTQRCAQIVDSKGTKTDGERLGELLQAVWDHTMIDQPEFASWVGIPGQNRWTDHSPEAYERRKEEAKAELKAFESIDAEELADGDQLNYELGRRAAEVGVESLRFPRELLPLGTMNGPHSRAPQTLGMMPRATPDEWRDILSRLELVPALLDQTADMMRLGMEGGVTMPKVVLRDIAGEIGAQIVEDPAQSPLLQPIQAAPPGFDEAEAAKLRGEAESIYRDSVTPALRSFQKFVSDSYVPTCRESIALSDLPDGEEWYAFSVRQMTTTDLTPKQIHDIGLSEVERIRAEMEKVIASAEFKGSFEDFLEFLRSDDRFFFEKPEELLAAYRDIAKRADPELAKLFGKLPRLPYGVTPVPDYIEKNSPTAYYQPGSNEAGRPGYFFANTYDLRSRPSWEMEALTLHEAVPGHHLQLTLASELEGLPEFRKWSFWVAYIEGWGLYSESLGEEMGFYTDPYSRFGALTYEMWRAIRLVVDTGMHSLGWTRDQAIDFFRQNAGKADHDIIVEVDRYIAWPGQALAYKIGELKLKELRSFAQEKLGASFDIRAFHDEVLGHGALPLDILERRIKAWAG